MRKAVGTSESSTVKRRSTNRGDSIANAYCVGLEDPCVQEA